MTHDSGLRTGPCGLAGADDAIIERVLQDEIAGLGPVENVTPVLGGFSSDRKYALWQNGRPAYLLRLMGLEEAARRKEEFDLIGRHYANGVTCARPHRFGTLPAFDACYSVLEYLSGESADIALPEIGIELHYGLGEAAGRELRRLHEVPGVETSEAWAERRWAKYVKYRTRVSELGLEFPGCDLADRYVARHSPLLGGRPVRFQHDDFHPANLIIRDGVFDGVIDFNRFDWGDPWEDFYKVPLFTAWTSPAFARGQVDGYFDGRPPESFWTVYNLYAAMVLSGCIGWAAMVEPVALPYFQERVSRIVATHDFHAGKPPLWYSGA